MREKREAWLKTALAPGWTPRRCAAHSRRWATRSCSLHADYAARLPRGRGRRRPRARAVDDDRVAEASAWLGRTPDALSASDRRRRVPRGPHRSGRGAPVLFGRGNRAVLQEDALWITGMTHADAGGAPRRPRNGAAAARAGLVVTTTLADGIEAEAAQGVLDAGGRLLVWFATGPNRVFPKPNLETVRRALATGSLILTPHPPGEAVSEAALGLRTACAAAYARGFWSSRTSAAGAPSRPHVRPRSSAATSSPSLGASTSAAKDPHQLIREGAKLAGIGVQICSTNGPGGICPTFRRVR